MDLLSVTISIVPYDPMYGPLPILELYKSTTAADYGWRLVAKNGENLCGAFQGKDGFHSANAAWYNLRLSSKYLAPGHPSPLYEITGIPFAGEDVVLYDKIQGPLLRIRRLVGGKA